MFCEKCGNQLLEDAKFCNSCGTKLDSDSLAYEGTEEGQKPSPESVSTYNSQQNYVPPAPQNHQGPNHSHDTTPLSVGQYVGMLLLMLIPLVNIILLFVWGFGGYENLNRRNYARASLILILATFILSLVIGGLIVNCVSSVFRNAYYY